MLRGTILPTACGLLALVLAVQVSVAGIYGSARPQSVLLWAPSDADAQAKLASTILSTEPTGAIRDQAIRLARRSLERSPLNPVAVRSLALAAETGAARDHARAIRLFKEAERLSRRDKPTQLWLIENAVREGRADAAIAGIDVFLRTSTDRTTLFSLLIETATASPEFAASLKGKLREKPDWAWPFAIQLVSQGRNAAQIVDLTKDILDPNVAEDRQVIDAMILRLSDLEQYELAWQTLGHFGLAERERLVDGDFEKAAGVAPFAWTFSRDPDLWAERQADPDGGGQLLRMAGSSGRAGEVARQLVRLPPGRHRIRASFGDVPADRFDRPELRLRCAGQADGRTLMSVKPTAAGPARSTVEGAFAVPDGCRFQWLTVSVTGHADQANTPWIDDIKLVTER